MENTKSKSFKQVKQSASASRATILTTLKECPDLTRYQLAQESGLRLSSVCGRVAEAIRDGLIEVSGTTLDSETGKTVQTLRLTYQ